MPVINNDVKILYIPPDTTAKEISFYNESKQEIIELSQNGKFQKSQRGINDGFGFQRYSVSEQNWMVGVSMAVVIIFIVARVGYHHKYRQLFQSLLASRYMKLAMREERALNHPFSVLLSVNYCLVTAMVIYMCTRYFSIEIPGWEGLLLYSVLFAGVWVNLLAKSTVKKMVRFIIGEDGGQAEDRFNLFFFNQALGIALIPPVIIACFADGPLKEAALWFAIAETVVFYLVRMARGFIVGLNTGSSAFYLFLYLCTLEITPLIVLVRVFDSEIG